MGGSREDERPMFGRNERQASDVNEVVIWASQFMLEQKNTNADDQICPSVDGMENRDLALVRCDLKDERKMKSLRLGMCDDPYCTTCPTYYGHKWNQLYSVMNNLSKQESEMFRYEVEGGGSRSKRICSFLKSCIPGVMNPHKRVVLRWNKFFLISCLFAIFLDPLFFLTFTVSKFRLAYVAPESRVVGAGELVDDPKKIARNYLSGYFIFDVFSALPLPQIIIRWIVRYGSGANDAKNFLRAAILFQYFPRLFRFIPLLAGQSPTGFVFESAWANFVINLLTYMLASHVVGSCWYLFALQRVNQCFRNACYQTTISNCINLINCDGPEDVSHLDLWQSNEDSSACLAGTSGFAYGIYQNAVNLTTGESLVTRYIYSFFWGFQQISTLAGNQVPSDFVWEVLFTVAIIGIGLMLFALLIGNIQTFLQALGRRRLEMTLRSRDVERWMKHRRLPEDLIRQVREAERFSWVATKGINEEMLMKNLPEDIQREIRRHLFKFVKKVRIFQFLDDVVIDAICERLRTKTYIKGSKIIIRGGLVDKMFFIIRGQLESVEENIIDIPLSEGDVCGEELLTWLLDQHSPARNDGNRKRLSQPQLLSNRTIQCLTNVEAFVLRAVDLEEVISIFSRFLRSTRVQRAIRYESPYWRAFAARRIQVAWRYRKKRLSRSSTSTPQLSPCPKW